MSGKACFAITLLVSYVLATPRVALGQVDFDVPPSCGSKAEFLAAVEALKAGGVASVARTSVRILQSAPDSYELRLTGAEGSRVLYDGDCRTLFRSAVVIAAANAPPANAEPAQASPESQPVAPRASEASPQVAQPPAPGSVPGSATPRSASVPPARPGGAPPAAELQSGSGSTAPGSLEVRVNVGLGLGVGLSPNPALLYEVGGALGSAGWGGALALRHVPRTRARTHGDLGVEMETLAIRAGAFHAPARFARLEAALSLYRFSAEGTGIRQPATDEVWLLAPEAELVLVAWLNSTWALEAGLQGRLGLTRPRFQVQPETEVFQLPRVGAGVVFRLQSKVR